MATPRWVADAVASVAGPDVDDADVARLAAAVFEQLPVAPLYKAVRTAIRDARKQAKTDRIDLGSDAYAMVAVTAAVTALAGDHDVVTITELYHGATRALDAAGAPYATPVLGDMCGVLAGPDRQLDMPGRIRWLASELNAMRDARDSARAARETIEARLNARIAELERNQR